MNRSLPLALVLLPALATAQGTVPKRQPTASSVLNPGQVPFADDFASRLKVPKGYRVSLFAKGLKNPRILLPLPDGTVLVSCTDAGQIAAVKNGVVTIALDGKPGVHGLALKGDDVYFATVTEVWTGRLGGDMRMKDVRRLTGNLPEGGQHPKRTLAFGPDGKLYIGVGSRTNDRPAPQPEDACTMRMNPDGSGLEIFAKGLRNSMALAFNPATGALWGFDQGLDYRGDDIPPEELNLITEGGHYGWPWVWGEQRVDPLTYQLPKGFSSLEEFARTTKPAVLEYQAHSAPIAMAFYPFDAFPEAKNDLFVTMRGSWNRDPATGYKVVRVRFDREGKPTRTEDFLTGFLTSGGQSYLGRPAGIAALADGSMLVGDDANGAIYRIVYTG